MLYPFKSSFSRALALFGLLGLGVVQVGCAHPVVVEPSVVVHSRIGHFPVYAQVGVPGPVIYAPPPPPPRVVYVPRVVTPVHGWGHGHERHFRGHERKHDRHDDREYRRGGWGYREDARR